jgi:hypothetical protein
VVNIDYFKKLDMKKITWITSLFFLTISYHTYSQSIATYDITFQSTWNEAEHSSIPANAHWSDLVGATHNNVNEFVSLGEVATTGIQNVAELGNNTQFFNEVNQAISNNNANQWLQQNFSPVAAISSATLLNVEVNEDYPLLTLMSMVAPSPDWFIAINSLNLRNNTNDDWKDTFSIDVFAYDAGTDNGSDYNSPNSPNTPVAISMINGFPINSNKMGTLTVTLKSILSVDSFASNNTILIYPNPSHGFVSIKKPNDLNIHAIRIYNILGKLVKHVNIENNNLNNIDLSSLKSGVYITKIEGSNNQIKTFKLIIK